MADKDTPLHTALREGDWKTALKLIEQGQYIDAHGEGGVTPFHLAMLYFEAGPRQVEIITALIDRGINIEAKRELFDFTPLKLATMMGEIEAIKTLLEKGAKIEAKDIDGQTPLYIAVALGKIESVEILLEKGANIKAKDKEGLTPLHSAANWGQAEAIKILLEKGAKIEAKDEGGHTPLHLATVEGKPEGIKTILEKITKQNVLPFFNIELEQIEAVKALLEKGADIEATNKEGQTPLHHATAQGKIETVKALLEKYVKIGVKDKEGYTPLHFATLNKNIDVAEEILEKYPHPNVKSKNGWTPLHVASFNGRPDMVEYLIKKGALVNAETNFNKWSICWRVLVLWGVLATLLGWIRWLCPELFTVSVYELFVVLLLPVIIILLLTRPTHFSAMAGSSGDGWISTVLSSLSKVLSKTLNINKTPFHTKKTFTIHTPLDLARRGMNQTGGSIENYKKVIEILRENAENPKTADPKK